MNTELIIKAVNAVIEFNELAIGYSDAGIQVKKYGYWIYIMWGINFDYVFNVNDPSDEDLQQFIDKLQELSQ